jgi:hypothetical protein
MQLYIDSMKSLRRLVLSALFERMARLASCIHLIPSRYYFLCVQRRATLSRRCEHRLQKFEKSRLPPLRLFSSVELRPSSPEFHVHAVAPTPTLLPFNSFLSSFVRQFHFTSRAALPTFVTLFQADFPRTAPKCFFYLIFGRSSFHLTR